MNAIRYLFSTRWAITQDALRVMHAIARRTVDLHAVEAERGAELQYTRTVSIRDGVAIVPIEGPIFRYANLFSDISGATSIQVLAQDFRTALHNPDVRAILLNINSPGGEVDGTHELAQMIAAARGTKPITAYVSHLGCSAAYWLASAADTIVCDATALVGSIGVLMALPGSDPDQPTLEFVSSQSPRKNPDPATDDGKADIQATLDSLAAVFIADVAAQRGVAVETVLSDFGQGGVFVGQQAVDAGLVDRLGSFEATLADLRRTAPMSREARTVMVSHSSTMTAAADALRAADTAQPDGAPAYAVGDRVQALVDHMEGMAGKVGTVAIVRTTPAYYGIDFGDGQPVHKWLAEDELAPAAKGAPTGPPMDMRHAVRPLSTLSTSFAPIAAAMGIVPSSASRPLPKEHRMSDTPQTPQATESAAPDLNALIASAFGNGQFTAQMQERFTALFTEQMQAHIAHAQQEAQRAAHVEIARMQRQRQIESYAQDITTPKFGRAHALPLEASAVVSFLAELNQDQYQAATGFFNRILEAGLVNFEEIGSKQSADDHASAIARYDEAIRAKVTGGMSRSAAIAAVQREQPDLMRAYNDAMGGQ